MTEEAAPDRGGAGRERARARARTASEHGDAGTAGTRRAAGVAIGGLVCFALLALAMTQGWSTAIDEAVLRAFRVPTDLSDPLGPAWFEDTMAEYTVLGGYTILFTLAGLLAIALILLGERAAALFLAVALASGTAVAQVAKRFFDRARPDLVDPLDRTMTSAFPSAHATVSMVAYLTLAMVIVRFVPRHGLRVYVVVVAVALSVVIGISRIYLGVHWPTDVLAGWSLGASWAAICWLAAHFLSRSRRPGHPMPLGHSRM